MTKIALYARVSTEEQAKEGDSIETQLQRLRSYVKFRDWLIQDEFVDPGWSGKDDNRPGLKRLIIEAEKARIDTVVVTKLDRFMRNTRLLLQYVDDLKRLGIRFIATDDNIDTGEGKAGELMLTIIAALAQWERERIGERIRESRDYRTSQGKWTAGATLFGYRWIPKKDEWQVVEHEAETVCKIYDFYLKQNMGSQKIPFLLNREGIHTRQGSKWDNSAVLRILSHSAYMGKHPNGIDMPPIIDSQVWQAAQDKRHSGRQIRRDSREWLLQGLVVCGTCGYTLSCRQRAKGAPRYYSCPGRTRSKHLDNSPYCLLPRLRSDYVEKEVWNKFASTLSDSDLLEQSITNALLRLEDHIKKNEISFSPINRQLEKVQKAIERHGLAFADGAIPEDVYREKLSLLMKQKGDLISSKTKLDPEPYLEIERLEDYIALVKKLLNKGSLVIEPDGIWAYVFGRDGGLMTSEYFGSGLDIDETIRGISSPTKLKPTANEDENFIALNLDSFRQSPKEARTAIMRSIFQKFNIKILAFPDRIEIQGYIPTQIINMATDNVVPNGERDISLASIIR